MSVCRSCAAPIVWVEIEASGRRMPLDPALDVSDMAAWPVDTAGLVAVRAGFGHVLANGSAVDTSTFSYHRSHFVTCPNAAEHRR